KGLDRLARDQAVAPDLDVDRDVVRRPGGHRVLWSLPNAVPAAQLKLTLAGLAKLLGILLEQVLAPDEPEPDDARSHVARYHQFDFAVTDPIAVGPALVIDLLNLDSGAQRHGTCGECAEEPNRLDGFHTCHVAVCFGVKS